MAPLINWIHVFGVAPLLGYIAYENSKNRVISEDLITVLIILIVLMVMFHAYRGFTYKQQN